MEPQGTPPGGEDAHAVNQLRHLATGIGNLQQHIHEDMCESPAGVLLDCYSEDYAVHTVKVSQVAPAAQACPNCMCMFSVDPPTKLGGFRFAECKLACGGLARPGRAPDCRGHGSTFQRCSISPTSQPAA